MYLSLGTSFISRSTGQWNKKFGTQRRFLKNILMSVALALGTLSQDDCCEFKVGLSSIVSLRSICMAGGGGGEGSASKKNHKGEGKTTQGLLSRMKT